jgi:polyhydroxyalkanoate synthase
MWDALGLGPRERRFRVIAAGECWRLREYETPRPGPPVLAVPAPIKQPYIWDLAPKVSAVARCLEAGLRVYLIEWTAPSQDLGLEAYADRAIGAAIAGVLEAAGEAPFLAGHSLGGVLAAIHAALDPPSARGLLLLSAPVCFAAGSTPFRDALVGLAARGLPASSRVPGSLLAHVSALASPETFLWLRLLDGALSLGDPAAMRLHARVERWALDEAPLPARLTGEILSELYREDRFCRGELRVGKRWARPAAITLPVLGVVNSADRIVVRGSVQPFLEAVSSPDVRLIDYPGEIGAALQHVGVLVGRAAHARVWPEILAWIKARA